VRPRLASARTETAICATAAPAAFLISAATANVRVRFVTVLECTRLAVQNGPLMRGTVTGAAGLIGNFVDRSTVVMELCV
jgi:hypothetical protein